MEILSSCSLMSSQPSVKLILHILAGEIGFSYRGVPILSGRNLNNSQLQSVMQLLEKKKKKDSVPFLCRWRKAV